MRASKILREPLVYLLPLLVASCLAVLIMIPANAKILDAKITKDGQTENVKFPYSVSMAANTIFLASFTLSAEDNESVKLNVIPDDCIREILVNGEKFPLHGIKGLCDYTKGAYIDFSKYTLKGLNTFEFRIINYGSPGGFKVKIPKQLHLFHYVFALFFLSSFILLLRKFKDNALAFKSLLLLLATAVFWVAGSEASGMPEIIPLESLPFLTAMFFGTSLIFLLNKRVNYTAFIFILTALAAFMLIRGGLLYIVSSDYSNFLKPWIRQMRELSIVGAISSQIGDYNMPYLYILMLISRFNLNDLYLIKFTSMIFDIVLAFYAMKIVSIKFESVNVQLAAFFAVFGIPTVILNGVGWAQCDVIYSALAIASLYYGFTDKSIRCLVFYGLALSFKLQSIFLAPVIIVLIFMKKVKVVHLWVLLLTFLATLLPALIAGKPFEETISIYYHQVNAYPELSVGASNIWVLLKNVKFENFNFVAILLTGVAVSGVLYFLYLNREKIVRPANYVSIAFVFALLVPMLLPRMHERYFFLADVFSVVLVFFNKKRWFFAPIIILGSFLTCSRFLLGNDYYIPVNYMSIAMLFVTLIAVKDLTDEVSQ
ncbi:MAG: hypothetical protein FWB90_02205 [Fibromonadales bacterium]|nr:hypothetical protein [Fibromonadales bacterium]